MFFYHEGHEEHEGGFGMLRPAKGGSAVLRPAKEGVGWKGGWIACV